MRALKSYQTYMEMSRKQDQRKKRASTYNTYYECTTIDVDHTKSKGIPLNNLNFQQWAREVETDQDNGVIVVVYTPR